MTPEEAKARVAEQKAKIQRMEAEVANFAQILPGPTMLAIMKVIVETLCLRDGPNFSLLYKEKFYEAVLYLLNNRGKNPG